jgi:hypothetical protein
MTETINEPSTADLVQAVWELSLFVGSLPSKTETDYISITAMRLIEPWIKNNVPQDQLSQWFDNKGPIRKAAQLGRTAHYGHD